MNNDLISGSALKAQIEEVFPIEMLKRIEPNGKVMKIYNLVCNAPTVNPCENCDLYLKAMAKEEMRKGGAE